MVNSPYGGGLKISLELDNQEKHIGGLEGAVKLQPFVDFFYDSLKLGDGSYSPLDGFMCEEELNSVVEKKKLLNGLPWTIPIFFAIDETTNGRLREGDEIALLDQNNLPYGVMDIETKYRLNKKEIAQEVYGTLEMKHPNVQDIFEKYGDYSISGKVKIYRDPELPGGVYEKHPSEVRKEFENKGWKNIVAYQARNPPHVAHEYLQKVSLELPGIDGLFVHLVVGRLKKGDYRADVIMNSYEALLKNYHRAEKAMMGSLSITMRYAGPRAAIFLAIIRRNYGATHYIIGRDQAGVGNYYDPYAAQRIFDEIDIGMIPLKFRDTFYCKKCRGITSENVCPHAIEDRMIISQTKIREMLKTGQEIPQEIIRPEIARILENGHVLND
ncbi:MAG: sulfate adenylyltransferase [Thermoplasmatales archaeon]|nr:sulfate adenylyltransferase [Thermoplasmatales archaeon]